MSNCSNGIVREGSKTLRMMDHISTYLLTNFLFLADFENFDGDFDDFSDFDPRRI